MRAAAGETCFSPAISRILRRELTGEGEGKEANNIKGFEGMCFLLSASQLQQEVCLWSDTFEESPPGLMGTPKAAGAKLPPPPILPSAPHSLVHPPASYRRNHRLELQCHLLEYKRKVSNSSLNFKNYKIKVQVFCINN